MKTLYKLLSLNSALLLGLITNQIQSIENRKIDFGSNILISNPLDNKGIKTVNAKGFGFSIDEAAKDAANNALKQVVGVFIDSETILQDRIIINDGIMQESSIIKENISEYSQGSIKYFEILSKQKIGSLYQVSARVDVRIKEFNTYLQQFAYKKFNFPGTNIATVINANKDNAEQSTRFFADKVIKPLIERSIYKIAVGEPKLLKNNLVEVPFTLYVDKEFIENIKSNLDNISTMSWVPYQKKDIPFTLAVNLYEKGNLQKKYFIKTTLQYINNMTFTSCKDENSEKGLYGQKLKDKIFADNMRGRDSMCGYNQYLFLKTGLSNKFPTGWGPYRDNDISDIVAFLNSKLTLPLHISLIDENKEVISKLVCGLRYCYQERWLKEDNIYKAPVLHHDRNSGDYDRSRSAKGEAQMKLEDPNSHYREYHSSLSLIDRDYRSGSFLIRPKKNYSLILNLSTEEISKIKDIEIKFEKLN